MLQVGAALPYMTKGPGFVLDDWFTLANAHFDGWLASAGPEQWRARPGAGVVYAFVFGVVGRHPLATVAVSTALCACIGVALWLLLGRFLPPRLSFAISAMWIVVPNHGSLLYWASATNVAVALLLLLLGLLALDAQRLALAVLLLAASVLCYEATAPIAVMGLIAVPRSRGRSILAPLVAGAVTLGPVAVWMLVFFHPAKSGLSESPELGQLLAAHVGWGVFPKAQWTRAAGLAATLIAVWTLVSAARRRTTFGPAPRLVAAGVAVILVGTAPFVRYFYAPLGAGDRVNVVASVGTALLWTGVLVAAADLGASLLRRLPLWAWRGPERVVGGVLVGAVAIGMMVANVEAASEWSRAGTDARAVLASLGPLQPGEVVEIEAPLFRRNVSAFLDDSNVSSAVQLHAGTRDVSARLVRPAR